MTELALACAIFAGLATLFHLVSTCLAAYRCRQKAISWELPADVPPVSVLRPVRGLDPYYAKTLRSGFELSYPDYELIFCCADAGDAAVPVMRQLIAQYPDARARLLIGQDNTTANPKLNNLTKGWRAARHEWVVMADANVLMPPGYL